MPKVDLYTDLPRILLLTGAEKSQSRAILEKLSDAQLIAEHSWRASAAIELHNMFSHPKPEYFRNYDAGGIVLSQIVMPFAQSFGFPTEQGSIHIAPGEPYFTIHLIPFHESFPSANRQRVLETLLLLMADAPLLISQLQCGQQAMPGTTKIIGTSHIGLTQLAQRFGFYVSKQPGGIQIFSGDIPSIIANIEARNKLDSMIKCCAKEGITIRSARINALVEFPVHVQ